MTQSLSLRKKNWPVYKDYLDFKFHGLTDLRANLKSYYDDDQTVDYSGVEDCYLERLMLAPAIDSELIERIKTDLSVKRKFE